MNRIVLRTLFAAASLFALLVPCLVTAQETPKKPEAATAQTGAQCPAAAAALSPAEKAHEEQVKNDWPWLGYYKEADLLLGPPAAGENRVVFMGDSITHGWHLNESFPGKPYINRGISGQTSPQMLLRFRQDVIDLEPKVVVILAGTNDLAENTGPMTLEETEGNLISMAELATASHIRVVLCSVLPAFDFPWHPGLAPSSKIIELNAWISSYAAKKGYEYVDYYSAMTDERGGLPEKLSKDGVHPNPAGYAIMAPLAQAGIEKAMAQ